MKEFELLFTRGAHGLKCLKCNSITYEPGFVKKRYCPRCGRMLKNPPPGGALPDPPSSQGLMDFSAPAAPEPDPAPFPDPEPPPGFSGGGGSFGGGGASGDF